MLLMGLATLVATFTVPEIRRACGLDTEGDILIEAGKTDECYIICDSAHKTRKSAEARVGELKVLGYNDKAGYLWIPEYKCLSDAQLFEVYIGPFKNEEIATSELCVYNNRFSTQTYGVKIWDQPIRGEFRCGR